MTDMDFAERAAAAILLTAMLAVGAGLCAWAVFFREACRGVVECRRTDLF